MQGSGYTSVSANWTEPAVTCNSTNDLFAPWIGIDGYGSSSVEQTGVATDCSSGSPAYSAWYEVYPAAPVYYSNSVAAGDSFTASVNRSGTSYTLRITDNTQGWTKTTTQSYAGDNASAEFILESPTGAYPPSARCNSPTARSTVRRWATRVVWRWTPATAPVTRTAPARSAIARTSPSVACRSRPFGGGCGD